MRYDPNSPINEEQWADLDESEQIDLVVDYHRRAGEKIPNLKAHAGLHVAVENQVLMNDETPIAAALGRLIDEGLDRHDAIHAIASVLSMTMFDAMHSKADDDFSAKYYQGVSELTATKWRVQDHQKQPSEPKRDGSVQRKSTAKKPQTSTASDDEVKALLARYDCPVAFHEVRTRFLGNIATPMMSASPLKTVEGLWGGSLPTVESVDEANELIGALIKGLWNRLTRHQERKFPFKLTRVTSEQTLEYLSTLATMRRQEVDGFFVGLFGEDDSLELPERADRGLDALIEMRALFTGFHEVIEDAPTTATDKQIATSLKHVQQLTIQAEREISAIVLACTRARRQQLASAPVIKPTFH